MRHYVGMALLLLGFAVSATAEQLSFSLQTNANLRQFQYRWTDAHNQVQQMAFNLDEELLADSPQVQQNYRPALAMRFVTVKLLQAARQQDPREVNIQIHQQGETVAISVQGRNEEKIESIQQQLREIKEGAFDSYLHDHYYTRYRNAFNQVVIKPAHTRYIQETTKSLIPLSQAFYEKIHQRSDAREYLNLLLGWVQNIPYDPILNRKESNGSGFAPPTQLLTENKGDCDSKSVLTAAITRAFLPDTPMALILLPEHALLGIALTPRSDEKTLIANGETYVLLEPTGPGLFKVGEVADSTALALAQGRYTIEPIQ